MEGQARFSLRLFGGFELSTLPDGEKLTIPGKRERVLLAYLAVSPNSRSSRRKLATLLWGDATDETALDNLRTCVWSLRKGFSDSKHRIIASEGEDIVLDATAFETDAVAFRKLAARPGKDELETAATLYTGPFLDGLAIENEEFESWRRDEAGRFKDQAVDVLYRLMTALVQTGEADRAIKTGLRLLRLEPLHEAAVRHLMRLHGATGRRASAIQLYRSLSGSLKSELDAQPEAETRATYAEIASGGEHASPPATAVATPAPSPSPLSRGSEASIGPQSAPQAFPAIGPPWRTAPRRTRPVTLNWFLASGLAAAVALFLFFEFGLQIGTRSGVEAARTAASSPADAISVAVLPFANLSGDASQEFFSDGMTEEITSALAKVPDLRVVGRTSAFQFKGKNQDLRAIGQALSATHLLEGSVRRTGNQVRITAELVSAEEGVSVWTESYDRDMTDVFAIQEDIARAIATALRTPLGLENGARLVTNRSINSEDYQQFLRAKALVRARGLKALTDAAGLLESVVSRDADFAPAWALLAQAYALTPVFHPAVEDSSVDALRRVVDASLPRAETAAQRSVALDPNNADGYLSLGLVQDERGKFELAEELYAKALTLDPNNPDGLHRKGLLLAEVGRVKEALAVMQVLRGLEPFVPIYNANAASVMMLNGKDEEARALLTSLPPVTVIGLGERLAELHAAMGRYDDAIDVLRSLPRDAYLPGTVDAAVRLLRKAPSGAKSTTDDRPYLGTLGFIYLYVGAPERALDVYDKNVAAAYLNAVVTISLWHPSFAPVRKTPHFKELVRKAGLVDYWRVRGWPEFCHPTTGDDFECS